MKIYALMYCWYMLVPGSPIETCQILGQHNGVPAFESSEHCEAVRARSWPDYREPATRKNNEWGKRFSCVQKTIQVWEPAK